MIKLTKLVKQYGTFTAVAVLVNDKEPARWPASNAWVTEPSRIQRTWVICWA